MFQKNSSAFIYFTCGNGLTEKVEIQINTSITKVEIYGVPSFVQIGEYLKDNCEFILSFKIRNKDSIPIFRKAVGKIAVYYN